MGNKKEVKCDCLKGERKRESAVVFDMRSQSKILVHDLVKHRKYAIPTTATWYKP